MRNLKTCVALLGGLAMLVPTTAAYGAFQGQNGKIAFGSTRPAPDLSGDEEIWVTRDDASAPEVPLTDNGGSDFAPAYSPDGKWVAFEQEGDIWKIRSNGDDPRQLTHAAATIDKYPAWSPDGKQIAFARHTPVMGSYADMQIVRMKSNGNAQTPLVTNQAGGPFGRMSWSPNGKWIAYTANGGDETSIHRFRAADGSDDDPLATAGNPSNPDYSPDGKRIIFEGSGLFNGGGRDLGIMSASGAGVIGLWGTTGQDLDPTFSPNGKRAAYVSQYTDNSYNIFTLRVPASGPAANARGITTTGPTIVNGEPSWQPK